MNHKVRARTVVRKLDKVRATSTWRDDLAQLVERALRRAARDARRIALLDAAYIVGKLQEKEPATDVSAFRRAALGDALNAILDMPESK